MTIFSIPYEFGMMALKQNLIGKLEFFTITSLRDAIEKLEGKRSFSGNEETSNR
jgi:hypothetical protein